MSENSSNTSSCNETSTGGQGTILFIAITIGIGAMVRHLLRRTPLPYTVVMLDLGLIVGLASNSAAFSFLEEYTYISRIDPHLLLFIFLPTLIFDSAFVMDIHTFKKTIFQSLLLAGPGLMLNTLFTALMVRYIFTYNWSWVTALLFGVILSATDPVAVIALLNELGISKQLSTVIEGESLLNDGVAIVIFDILLFELIPGQSRSALDIFVYLIRVALGGPAFGYIMARLTAFWLSLVFNDAVVEITITLASTYFTYYVGAALLQVSGVLAVVTLGIEVNARRTNISPEVEIFIHKFWGILSYLANTLIFTLVGFVIAKRAFSGVGYMDWIFLVTLYFGINVIRLMVNIMFAPILAHTGYPISWKGIMVITWGGLRGAVGLALALVVEQSDGVPQNTIGNRFLFLLGGIILLTLIINATTVGFLLDTLGLSDISHARRVNMSIAIRRINDAKARAVRILKIDRFLADSHWEVVEEKTVIENPFDSDDEELEAQAEVGMAPSATEQNCPQCNEKVPHRPNPKEVADLAEDLRMRILKAEKTSYWKQYEDGQLNREAVLMLSNLADSAMDTPNRLLELKDIESYWRIPKYLIVLRFWLERMMMFSVKFSRHPKLCFFQPFHRLISSKFHRWFLFCLVIVDIVVVITQLSVTDVRVLFYLNIANYVTVGLYSIDILLKLLGLRQHFFKSPLNLPDFILVLVSWIDIMIELILGSEKTRVPPVFHVIITLKALRLLRIFIVIKSLLPLLIRVVDYVAQQRLQIGYGIGKGFVIGEEEILQQFDRIASVVRKSIAYRMKGKVDSNRLKVIRSLGLMRKEHPEVALSVKTRHAIHGVLNHSRDTITHLQEGGILDEDDADKLLRVIEVKMKRLQRASLILPLPDPHTVLRNHPWLSGLDNEILRLLEECAELEQRQPEDVLLQYREIPPGIHIIVSGLVKVITFKTSEDRSTSFYYNFPIERGDGFGINLNRSTLTLPVRGTTTDSGSHFCEAYDFYSAGSVLGEKGILEHQESEMVATCETDVLAFFIGRKDLEELMRRYPVLESRLWRILGVHIAATLLVQLSEYQDWPMHKLLLMLHETAYIVTVPDPPVLDILNDWRQIIVISGAVQCMDTHEKLVAPCIVPGKVGRLLMDTGNPKVLVVGTSKNIIFPETTVLKRYPKKTLKLFLRKIQKLIWLLMMRIRCMLMERFTRCWESYQRRYIPSRENSTHTVGSFRRYKVQPSSDSNSTYEHDQIVQIDPPSSGAVRTQKKRRNTMRPPILQIDQVGSMTDTHTWHDYVHKESINMEHADHTYHTHADSSTMPAIVTAKAHHNDDICSVQTSMSSLSNVSVIMHVPPPLITIDNEDKGYVHASWSNDLDMHVLGKMERSPAVCEIEQHSIHPQSGGVAQQPVSSSHEMETSDALTGDETAPSPSEESLPSPLPKDSSRESPDTIATDFHRPMKVEPSELPNEINTKNDVPLSVEAFGIPHLTDVVAAKSSDLKNDKNLSTGILFDGSPGRSIMNKITLAASVDAENDILLDETVLKYEDLTSSVDTMDEVVHSASTPTTSPDRSTMEMQRVMRSVDDTVIPTAHKSHHGKRKDSFFDIMSSSVSQQSSLASPPHPTVAGPSRSSDSPSPAVAGPSGSSSTPSPGPSGSGNTVHSEHSKSAKKKSTKTLRKKRKKEQYKVHHDNDT